MAMLLVVRERRKEIGVLKAIGASNVGVITQFISESIVLTLAGTVVGIIIGVISANPILKVLLSNATTSPETATEPIRGGGGPGFMRLSEGLSGARDTLINIQTNVDYHVLLYGFAAAMLIAVLGSIIPALAIAKIRPAEILKGE